MNICLTVYGTPTPQGSTRAFVPKGWKRAVITTDNKKLKPWRQEVSGAAMEACAGNDPTREAVEVHMDFYLAKPKSTSKKVIHKTTKPDIDKLARGILDALTGIVFVDDAQVVRVIMSKRFGQPERAVIVVSSLAVLPSDLSLQELSNA